MYTANLLKILLPELILFILRNLGIQDLKNCRSINDIWKREISSELTKRIILMHFQVGNLVQGKYKAKEFFSKLKKCNMSISYSEEHLKWLFLKGLSFEN